MHETIRDWISWSVGGSVRNTVLYDYIETEKRLREFFPEFLMIIEENENLYYHSPLRWFFLTGVIRQNSTNFLYFF